MRAQDKTLKANAEKNKHFINNIGIALLYFFLQLQGKQALPDFRAT